MVKKCEDCGIKATPEKPVRFYNTVGAVLHYDCYHLRRVKLNGRTCDCYICKPTKRDKQND